MMQAVLSCRARAALQMTVGNAYLQQDKQGGPDELRVRAIEALTDVPLVIHGRSGVPVAQRPASATGSINCKYNIGTELRMAFGRAMRAAVNSDPSRFDRVSIMKDTHDRVVAAIRTVLSALGHRPKGA